MKNQSILESQNRREFVKKTALASTGILLSSLPLSAGLHLGGIDEIKVALVGCGGRGTGAASQAMKADPGVRLVAMADAFEDQIEKSLTYIKKSMGDQASSIRVTNDTKFVGFDAYRKAIDLADVVILTTPPGFRPAHFEYAVEQGKQIFMEKPVATDVVGIKRVLKAAKMAKAKKLNVIVGLQRHYQKSYLDVYSRLQKGKIGDIVSGQVYWNSDGVWVREREPGQSELEYQMRNWYYFNWLCGDHILEQHIHNIDVANWFIGATPVSAQGMGGREVRKGKDHGEIFDHHFVEFMYPNGAVISSQCRHQPGTLTRVEEAFQGTKGTILVDSNNKGIMKGYNGKTIYQHDGANDINPYQQEHNQLFAAIRAGEYKYSDAELGANSSMTSILGRMATYSGQLLTWDAAMASNMDLGTNITSWDDRPPVSPNANGEYLIAKPGETNYLS